MKTRIIQTKFWSDKYILDLSVNARLLFIYVLTNKEIGLTGIYEHSIIYIELETGLNKRKIIEAFKEIEDKVKVCYSVASQAREKGLDPLSKVEIPIARSLAERVVGLISMIYPQITDPKIVKRIVELEKEYGMLDHTVALKIAEEIAKEKFCKFKNHEEAIDAGMRVGFAYITVGVVASPLEGYTHFKLKKTKERPLSPPPKKLSGVP